MLRQLIINADDFGVSEGVSRGILKAHQAGIVTSTSVMINFPTSATWIKRAQQEAPGLGLGLHLTLTAGTPAAPADQITDLIQADGTFYQKTELLSRLPQLDPNQIAIELRAQAERFEQIAGLTPDHLDSHHHITYMSPLLLDVMTELAQQLEIPIRNPLPREGADLSTVKEFLDGTVIESQQEAYAHEMLRVLQGFVETSGITMPDGFIPDFFGDRAILGELLLMLLDVPEGVSELMCHPGEVDATLTAQSSYTSQRANELEVLMHPSVREVIHSEFIQLINFGDIKQ